MNQYAKFEGGALQWMGRVPNISNPTNAQIAAHAAANGYKRVVHVESPGRFYSLSYLEGPDDITEVWSPYELQEAKDRALAELQGRRDCAMFGMDGKGVVIECSALPNGILFNQEAHNMVNSLLLLSAKGALPATAEWTDAADVSHPVTDELVGALVDAMMGHIQAVQGKFKPSREAVNEAEDVEAVEAALKTAEEN